jgi:hypothetical protein
MVAAFIFTVVVMLSALTAAPVLAAGPPQAPRPEASNVAATSAHIVASFRPEGLATEYRIEYTTEPENKGSWALAPNGAGSIPATEDRDRRAAVDLTGLSPGTAYYVRLFVKSSAGEVTSSSERFVTAGPPTATTFATHSFAAGEETIRALGAVERGGSAIDEEQTVTVGGGATAGTFKLCFEGQCADVAFVPHETEPGEDSEEDRVQAALASLPNIGNEQIYVTENFITSSYTIQFVGRLAGQNLPQITAEASGLEPSGTVTVATVQNGGPFAAHYHFEYTTAGFAGCGTLVNPSCLTTPEVEFGAGKEETELVGVDLPGLEPGQTYHYRLAASNEAAPQGVEGNEQTLTVPAAVQSAEEVCSNAALRSGHSAHLPDCRAYEQVTPVDKEGAEDMYKYGLMGEGSLVGEDGEHFMLHAPGVQWGASSDDRISNYFFTRASGGWQMTSARPQGEAGPDSYQPFLFGPDLTENGLEVEWDTSVAYSSPDVELEAGPPGGPYTPVASIPRADLERERAWIGASADGSKLILQTTDRTLSGHSSTTSGNDLYEFAGGELRQVNVLTGGQKISACGARLARGYEGYEGSSKSESSAHAVSADGARVFFVDNCTHDLYLRVGGAETIDIGQYTFLAANREGSKVLLEKLNGEIHEVLLYESEAGTTKPLFSTQEAIITDGGGGPPVVTEGVNEELTAIYFFSTAQLTPEAPPPTRETGFNQEDLYRYDILAGGEPLFVAQSDGNSGGGFTGHSASPDGRYFYWISGGVGGVPGGAGQSDQVYRYDSVEDVVQCMSCASPFDPQPKLSATFLETGTTRPIDGMPDPTDSSANGDYVFFDSISALVPEDVDGEVEPEQGLHGEHPGTTYTPSSDVYEWRKYGIDGCGHLQGCLALISSGTGGFKNVLLGTTESGRDVFFATHDSLVPGDDDTAGDIYDARIGGGFPPAPPRPVECEGDSCSTPFAAPSDLTPSSATFQGAGDVVSATAPQVKGSSKAKPKKKPKKQRAKPKRRGKLAAHAKRSVPAKRSVHSHHGGAK